MTDTPLHFMTITELAALIKARQVSPVEVTDAMLRRIESLDGKYKSYATVMADHAEAAAKAAEAQIAAGQYRGPLHGVPFAVKDLCFTKGVRTMGGSKVYADHIPSFDSTVVVRLNAAGSVPLGKLNLTEGAMGGYNPALNLPLNPWNTAHWAGSSSSGSGVATAAGLCFGSLGSDTGGSIRFPAAACGTVGLKPTWGRVSRYDATVVARLNAAGSVPLGKLNLTEGAMGGYNPALELPLNPWNTGHWAGSSSSGSGVATAAGLCFGSLGSDTGGSIRFPAAACGTVGLKPTWGRVSRYGVLALAESLDHVGPLTRSSADAAIALQAIAGHDPSDPTSLPAPVPDMLEGIDGGVKGVRIGLDEKYATDGVDPELAAAVLAGVKVMEELGAEIVPVQMPDVDSYLSAWPVLCSAEAVAAHKENYPSRREDYGLWFRGWLDMGAGVTGADYAAANNRRAELNGLIRDAFHDIDALACPSVMGPARAITPEEMYGPMSGDRGTSFQRYTVPYDYNGAPTISLPCGLNGDGLPLSLQFVGKSLSEPMLCRIGHAFEQATDWHNLHPPIDDDGS